ncbi:uncharacterized protein EV420DRAFT_1472477 [Desarmillaria tabescens]|uniref:Uncharacterized protein n=1 Tax=Armillaria tabescens TaxID=1929756 RepID=A0AA39TSX7_ARMTA|nr:uncharacterized protein EV420DRAFT_1472477 [Desarmillaria tabescens]KAK0469212.1 hypothetical protein EV420DRAFT_1472477 [Desarmillaria tabescens]
MAETWEISGLGPIPHSAISILGVFESFKHLPHCAVPWSGREYESKVHYSVAKLNQVSHPQEPSPTCALVFFVGYSTKIQELNRYCQRNGLTGTLPVFNPYMLQEHYLCPATPKTEFPCAIPDSVTLCDPILVSASPVEERDREIVAWLDRAAAILVNLETHVKMDEMNVHQLAMALRILPDRERKIQVIWKLKAPNDVKASLLDILGVDMNSGRVKVVDWLDIEHSALLRHHNIVCVVSHGAVKREINMELISTRKFHYTSQPTRSNIPSKR